MKKAFTLVELVIAIAIFSLLITYMYQAVATTKKTTQTYENMYKSIHKISEVKKLLYNDIFNQTDPYSNTSVSTSGNFSTYYLRSNNSLHGLTSPFIAYKVINSNLYRFESTSSFKLPLTEENKNSIKLDIVTKNVTNFTIYTYKNSHIIDLNSNGKRTFLEIALPYSKKVIVVGG